MFAREGYVIIGVAALIGALLASVGFWLGFPWGGMIFVVAVGLIAFTLFFFRDPDRQAPPGAREGNLLLAPADGKVVEMRAHEDEPLYLDGPAQRISIFLSPLNVHVNRVPADGIIEYVNYVAGDYLVAWHPKASKKNERSELGLLHPSGRKVLFKQIAGKVARRIVYHLNKGDTVHAGERFGLVKFGSRMDVFVPPDVTLDVKEGDRVRAGLTVLGRLPMNGETSHTPHISERSFTPTSASSS